MDSTSYLLSRKHGWLVVLAFLLIAASLACALPFAQQVKPTPTAAVTPASPTPPPSPTPTQQPLPPALVESQPAPGEEMPLRGPITLYFNQAMNRASVESATAFTRGGQDVVPGRVEWQNDATLRFLPQTALPPDTELVVQVNGTAASALGLALAEPIQVVFRTAGYLNLSQALPEPGTGDVDPSSAVVAAFNRPVVPLGAESEGLPAGFSVNVLGPAGEPGPEAAGRGEWLNTSTYIFYPEPALEGGKAYSVRLNPDLRSIEGSPLLDVDGWSFTTSFPRLVSVQPEAGSQRVRLDTSVQMTFNQPMDPQSVANYFRMIGPNGAVIGNITWEEDNTILTFTPSSLLERGSIYTISLEGQAQALGGTSLGSDQVIEINTVSSLAITGTNPAPGGVLTSYDSLAIQLSSVIPEENLVEPFTFSPAVPNMGAWWDPQTLTVYVYGTFSPSTTYTLRVDSSLTDVWGSSLDAPYELNFRTAPLDPGLSFLNNTDVIFLLPTEASIPVQATNVESVLLTVGSLSLEDYLAMMRPSGYNFRMSYQAADGRTWEQPFSLEPDLNQTVEMPVTPDGQPLSTGLYFMRLLAQRGMRSPETALLAVSNVHVTYKSSPTEALVWAVDLRGNAPLANAPVNIYDENGTVLVSGQTDAQGIFKSEITPLEDPYKSTFAVVGQPRRENFGLAVSYWDQGVASWDFDLISNFQPPHLETYIYTDRPIYRPGQTVYFRAVVRQAYNGRYELPDVESIPVTIRSGLGETLAVIDLPLSAYGTSHGEYTLPTGTEPGYYDITTNQPYASAFLGFQVANYRKPEINLKVGFSAEEALMGESIQANVDARYFFDAPVSNAPVRWSLYTRRANFYLPGYQTGLADTSWMDSMWIGDAFGGPLGMLVESGEAQTSPEGTLQLVFEDSGRLLPDERQIYTLEVTLEDESGRPVSARSEIGVNPSTYYVGVRPDRWTTRAGEPVGFDVLAVDWDQVPNGAHALRAEFAKVVWKRINTPNMGIFQTEPTFQPEYTLVDSADFTTSADGQARLSFTPPEPGTYQLSLAGIGQRGSARTELLVWVSGPGQVLWPDLPNQRLELTPSREVYQPGETAEVFIPNPFGEAAQALVTIERSTILQHEVIALDPEGINYTLSLTNEHTPNVYLSVVLLGQDDLGRPDFRRGLTELKVEPVDAVLRVSLIAQPERTKPGDEVTFDVLVTDANDQPVQGEFSLAVVDMAVLALADPNSLPIADAFYKEQPLGVRTGLTLVAYARRNLFIPGGGGGGGGEAGPPEVVRESFPDTAYWNAEIITGPDGRAEVTVPLPDSLTTWQVDLRGITTNSRVGQAQAQIVTSKDLLVRPVTPRFLVANDHTRLAAIVQNNTATDLRAAVSLQGSGLAFDRPDATVQEVTVPANGRVSVEWWATAQAVESVDMIFSVQAQASGDAAVTLYQDAARPSLGALPVLHYNVPQAFRTAGTLESAGDLLELVSMPRSFDPTGAGSLQIELAPSLAAALMDTLDALEHFPYECTEQTLSRFLPNLETYRTLQSFGVQSPALQSRLERTLAVGVRRLTARQNYDGGWGWWRNGESDPYITAYILFGLNRAQDAGIVVNSYNYEQAINYLKSSLPLLQASTDGYQLDRQSLIHYVLAQAGFGDPAGVQQLYARRDELSPWARAILAMALERIAPGSTEARTLLSDLSSTAERSATGAFWEIDTGRAMPNMMDTLANSAVVVYALAQRDPGSPLLGDAVRYLMAHRQVSGAWSSTYTSAWSVLALVEVMKGTGELGGAFEFAAGLNGAQIASGAAGGSEQLNPVKAELPLSSLYSDVPNTLTIRRGEGTGRLYYTAALNVSRPVDTIEPVQAGVSVSRAYYLGGKEGMEAGNQVSAVQSGDLVRVRLSLTLPKDVYHLIVEDYIPAGAEVLDTSLKTTQLGLGEEAEAGPVYNPRRPFENGWGWWLFHNPQIYDDRIAWAADYLPAGTYELTYTLVTLQPGEYHVLPAHAWQFYFPEVKGTSAGEIFTIQP